jgi:N,N'-diacetyllegionaminate synthase
MGVYIIAEAGVNHNGKIELAKMLADIAKEADADCVKFQTFVAEASISKFAEKAEYQKKNTGVEESQLAMVKRLELNFADFAELKNHCAKIGIDFLSTAFDTDSVDFLKSIGQCRWKIPSGEITNFPLIKKIGRFRQPVILSSGMSTLEELRHVVKILRDCGTEDLTVLHCTTEYPAPFEDVNLNAMSTIRNEIGLPVGYSDHTEGVEIPVAAAALGAVIIEKHFTIDKAMDGPDHKASLNPEQLKDMVKAIRNTEKAMGDGRKIPADSEKKNIVIARKSIVAAADIKRGEIFTEKNLTVKRPGNGISPMRWFDILGKPAGRDYAEDELIES